MLDQSDLSSSLTRARLEHRFHPALFLKSYIDSVEATNDWSDSLLFMMEFLYTISLQFQEAEDFRTVVGDFLLKLDLNNVPESDQAMCYLFMAFLDGHELSGQAFQLATQYLRASKSTTLLQLTLYLEAVTEGNDKDRDLALLEYLSLSNDQRDYRCSIEARNTMASLTTHPYEKLNQLDMLKSVVKRANVLLKNNLEIIDLISQDQHGGSDAASLEELRLTIGLPSSMQDAINASHDYMAGGRFGDAFQIMNFNTDEETPSNQMRVIIQRSYICLTAGMNVEAKRTAQTGLNIWAGNCTGQVEIEQPDFTRTSGGGLENMWFLL